jgi:hypothetical protein
MTSQLILDIMRTFPNISYITVLHVNTLWISFEQSGDLALSQAKIW